MHNTSSVIEWQVWGQSTQWFVWKCMKSLKCDGSTNEKLDQQTAEWTAGQGHSYRVSSLQIPLGCWLPEPTIPLSGPLRGMIHCIWYKDYNGFKRVTSSPFNGLHGSGPFPVRVSKEKWASLLTQCSLSVMPAWGEWSHICLECLAWRLCKTKIQELDDKRNEYH